MVSKIKPIKNLEQGYQAGGNKPFSHLPPKLNHGETLGISVYLTGAFVSSSERMGMRIPTS